MKNEKLCRKTSKGYSRDHVFLIANADPNGNAVCSFCGTYWNNQ